MEYVDRVSPSKTGRTTQVALRIEDAVLARVDALVDKLSPPGMSLARSEVLRAALLRGVESLEAEHSRKKR